MVNPPPRKLTAGESAILAIIRDRFGDRNTPDEVFFTDTGEAALFIKAPDGNSVAAANLTNLAAWREMVRSPVTRSSRPNGCQPSNHAMERTADRCAFHF